jgi:phage terminase large subunit-like protein
LAELLAFPQGKHDDQVDSMSQALRWMTARSALRQPRERPVGRMSRYIL